jgi:uncharacterized membrane protein
MAITARDFFTPEEQDRIKQAIAEAEKETSGEIRLHIENDCEGDVLDRAATLFDKLGMARTAARNGVLFYVSIKARKFAILGDLGINAKVPHDFWDQIRNTMIGHFREENFCEGLVEGIIMAGQALKTWFPYASDDVNELPDDISFGK